MKVVLNILILAGFGAILWAGIRPDLPDVPETGPQAVTVTASLRDSSVHPESAVYQTDYYVPASLRERVAAAAEACFSGWGEIDGLGAVTPQGGAPLDGEAERYGCVGTGETGTSVFAVLRYAGGDRTRPEGYVMTALCDGEGVLLRGSNPALCDASPL